MMEGGREGGRGGEGRGGEGRGGDHALSATTLATYIIRYN